MEQTLCSKSSPKITPSDQVIKIGLFPLIRTKKPSGGTQIKIKQEIFMSLADQTELGQPLVLKIW